MAFFLNVVSLSVKFINRLRESQDVIFDLQRRLEQIGIPVPEKKVGKLFFFVGKKEKRN